MIDDPVFCGLAVIFTFIFLLSVGSFFKIIPSLGDCVMRWKGNLDLEDSLQLSGSRNWMVMVLFVPLCMVVMASINRTTWNPFPPLWDWRPPAGRCWHTSC